MAKDDLAAFQAAATARRMTVSAWMRAVLLRAVGRRPPPSQHGVAGNASVRFSDEELQHVAALREAWAHEGPDDRRSSRSDVIRSCVRSLYECWSDEEASDGNAGPASDYYMALFDIWQDGAIGADRATCVSVRGPLGAPIAWLCQRTGATEADVMRYAVWHFVHVYEEQGALLDADGLCAACEACAVRRFRLASHRRLARAPMTVLRRRS